MGTMDVKAIGALVAEVEHLRNQRDELQRANTRLLEELREAKRACAREAQLRRLADDDRLRLTDGPSAFGQLTLTRFPDRFTAFVKAMAAKFEARAHKGDWRGEPIDHYLRCLVWETGELIEAIDEGGDVRTECADIAISALILDDLYDP